MIYDSQSIEEQIDNLNLTKHDLYLIKQKYDLIDNQKKYELEKIDYETHKFIFFDFDTIIENDQLDYADILANSKLFNSIDKSLYENLTQDSLNFITSIIESKLFNHIYLYEHKLINRKFDVNENYILLTSKSFSDDQKENIKVIVKKLYSQIIDVVFNLDRSNKIKYIQDFLNVKKIELSQDSPKPNHRDIAYYNFDEVLHHLKKTRNYRYAFISKDDYFDEFQEHNIQFVHPSKDSEEGEKRDPFIKDYCQLLQVLYTSFRYAFCWDEFFDEDNVHRHKGYEDDYGHPTKGIFDKIIFLDIDGVLNTDIYKNAVIEPEMVRNLKYIVEETNAQIVLSSSWKSGYYQTKFEQLKDERINLLIEELKRIGLSISGLTPFTDVLRGGANRPFEIKKWLERFPTVESFVILDDQTHWYWNWLKEHVVTTITKVETKDIDGNICFDCKYGLTKEHAQKAIDILNHVKR